MSEAATLKPVAQRVSGLLAEFEDPARLVAACREVRLRGYRRWDAHTPFPLHELDDAMGLGNSPVGWLVFALGLGGALAGMLLQWWVASVAYPLDVGGKPLFSWPAFVPVAFEIGVLGGAIGALSGFLILARLPRLHHPLFESERFERVTDDGFFVSIDARDPRFRLDEARSLLVNLGAVDVEVLPG